MIQTMLTFPAIDPEIFSVSLLGIELALRWYALAYIVGILIGWFIVVRAVSTPALWANNRPPLTREQVEDLVFWIILGIILGGRLGFVLFYQPGYFFSDPTRILQVWQGGMAFHGGFLGVVIAVTLFARRHKAPLLSVADLLAVATPMGILLGRLANFINAELWGRPTDAAWGVTFPTMCVNPATQGCPQEGAWFFTGFELPRHPSQLYEAGLEGLLLGAVLIWLVWRRDALHRPGLVTGVFFAGYGLARMFVELFRSADAQFVTPDNPLGHVISLGPLGLTMGQLLSLPMVVLGAGLIQFALRRAKSPA